MLDDNGLNLSINDNWSLMNLETVCLQVSEMNMEDQWGALCRLASF